MKLKKVLALVLALVFMWISVIPAFAEGEEVLVPDSDPMEQGVEEVPEEGPEDEDPEGSENLEEMEDPEQPEVPEKPEDTEEPEEAEDANDPETPENPSDPEVPEDLDDPETSEDEELAGNEAEEDEPAEDEGSEEDSEETEDSEDKSQETSEQPDEEYLIDVVVPTDGHITINPYRLKVKTGAETSTAQIVHQPQAFFNNSAFPVAVNVSVMGTVPEGSEVVLVSNPPTAGRKEVFLYAEFQYVSDWWIGDYLGAPNQLIASEDGSYGENVLVLDVRGEGYFRLSGAMSEDSFWENTDTFGAVLVFTFSAAAAEISDEADLLEEPGMSTTYVWEEESWSQLEEGADTNSPAVSEVFPEPEAYPEPKTYPEPEIFPEPEEPVGAEIDGPTASAAMD